MGTYLRMNGRVIGMHFGKIQPVMQAGDPRNGILWNLAIEHAFDTGRLTIYEDDGHLRFHILDGGLAKIAIAADLMGTEGGQENWSHCLYGDKTFGELEGQKVLFLNDARPFRRCLCLHARVTRLAAIERG